MNDGPQEDNERDRRSDAMANARTYLNHVPTGRGSPPSLLCEKCGSSNVDQQADRLPAPSGQPVTVDSYRCGDCWHHWMSARSAQ